MREIKFRAWDRTSNVMVRGMQGDWYLRPDGKPVLIDREGEEEKINDYVLMQFTGLLDKNGKEIFEGDIVKSLGYKNQMVVEYKEIQESDDMTAPGIGFQFMTEPSTMEIIGNIYENGELLN